MGRLPNVLDHSFTVTMETSVFDTGPRYCDLRFSGLSPVLDTLCHGLQAAR
jgi:hypothetical protein